MASRDHDHTAGSVLEVAAAVEVAEAAADVSRRLLRDVDTAIREAKQQAAKEVDERFRAQREAAVQKVIAAERDVRDAKDRLPDHAWTGRRVFKMEATGPSWSRETKRVDGVVEMRRSSTPFPGNAADYSLPALGEAFVRLVKKDGTPGLQFARLHSHRGWKLVEAEAA